MLLLMTLVLRVFHSHGMYRVIVELLRDYLPAGQDFVIRNLNAMASARNRVQVFSFFILLVTSTGVFMPLEVALNRPREKSRTSPMPDGFRRVRRRGTTQITQLQTTQCEQALH